MRSCLLSSCHLQSRAQHSKVGHTGSTEQSTDVMYDLSSSIIAENTVVSYQNMQARTTVMSKDTEGADEMYDYVRPSSVAGPEFSKTPVSEHRICGMVHSPCLCSPENSEQKLGMG